MRPHTLNCNWEYGQDANTWVEFYGQWIKAFKECKNPFPQQKLLNRLKLRFCKTFIPFIIILTHNHNMYI